MSLRTRSPVRIPAALAFLLAALLALLLVDTTLAAAETPSVKASELHAHAGAVSLLSLGLVPVRGEERHNGFTFRLRDVTGTRGRVAHRHAAPDSVSVGEGALKRSANARRRARRRVRDARDHAPVQGIWLLPFVVLIGFLRAVSVRVTPWIAVSDIRLPAERGPPSPSPRAHISPTAF
jgi:hypothetical protein